MLAIVIPYYKLAFFESTIQSLASQTDKRFRVYIGDDASEESPTVLLDKYRKDFDFVYHRFENNLGRTSLSKQWERCIALSESEQWILVLGDDDYLGVNVVQSFYAHIDSIVCNQIHIIRYATKTILNGVVSALYEHSVIERATDSFFRKLSGETRSSLSEYIFNKEKLLEVGFKQLPLAWYADDLAVLEVSNFSNVYSINDAMVYITISNSSISGDRIKYNKDKNKAEIIFFRILIENHKSRFTKTQLSTLVVALSRYYFKSPSFALFSRICLYFVSQLALIDLYYFAKKEGKRHLRKLKEGF